MNGSVNESSDDRARLKQALVDYQAALLSSQAALLSTASSFNAPPFRPVGGATRPIVAALRTVLDKKGMEASLRPIRTASEEVVRCFATAAGVDEQTAKANVQPLRKELGVLAVAGNSPFPATMSWNRTADGEAVKQTGDSAAEPLARRSERLNAAAVDALLRFYLEGRHPPHDEPFAETRRAWDAYESVRLRRFRRRARVAASERHQAAWKRWAAAQQV